VAALSISSAWADAWDKKTRVTFREAVEFPGGTVLAPGNYVLKLLNSATDRHIVQVYDQDQQHMYAMVMAIPAQRNRPAEKTILTFYETPRDRPAFIRTWFYPGDTVGQEFPYPKTRPYYVASAATPIVATTTAPDESSSRATASPILEESSRAPSAEVEDPGQSIADTANTQGASSADEPVLLAQATPQQAAPRAQANEPAAAAPIDQLPETAGHDAYWAIGSMILLTVAFILRVTRLTRS
jgi:hypothetical protein